jgi:hypothetical protein
MNFNPLDDIVAVVLDPDRDRSWLWNPLHPSAAFGALVVIVFALLIMVLGRGG